jgi:peptidoglycan/LPS O-acetylase OafA/YrhL
MSQAETLLPVDESSAPSPKAIDARANAATTRGRVDSLDGVRAISVLAVMLVHAGFPGAELGWLGVDMFFVLSGFLITTLLCEERRRNGSIHLGKFWLRRFLRLMPAYWLFVGTITIWLLLHPLELKSHGGWSPSEYIASLWLYFVNYLPMGGIWKNQYLTVHLWSLAVEEQFYLLWPIAAYFAFRLKKPWVVAWCVLLAVLVHRSLTPTDQMGATLPIRGIGIVLGCTAALTIATGVRPAWLQSVRLRNAILGISGLAVVALTVAHRRHLLTEGEIKSWFITWLAILFTLLVAMLWYGPSDRLTSVLASRPMKYCGQISYGMYLFHIPAQWIVWKLLLPGIESWNKYLKYPLRLSAYFVLTLVIATLSYQLVERRFLALKDRLR